jgi:hypothetical protein
MLTKIKEASKVDNLPLCKLLQVSSDGPSVNKLPLDKLNTTYKEAGLLGLFDIGPLNLYFVHNAFAAVLKSIEQREIKELLLDVYQWFKYYNPRGEDNVQV